MSLENKNQNHSHDKHDLKLIINGKEHDWHHQYITGFKVRELGNIPKEDEIFLAIKRPWEDEFIMDDTEVDLARDGREHFFSKKHNHPHLVKIFVNDTEKEISRGKHTVAEIKTVGEVVLTDVLDELIDSKLTRLADDASVLIKGCEQFFSRVRGGTAS